MHVAMIELTAAAFTGILLGGLYFGGLWLTVNRASEGLHPGLLMAASFLFRLIVVAVGLYIMADGHWERYAAAVPGLLAARWMLIRHLGQPVERRP